MKTGNPFGVKFFQSVVYLAISILIVANVSTASADDYFASICIASVIGATPSDFQYIPPNYAAPNEESACAWTCTIIYGPPTLEVIHCPNPIFDPSPVCSPPPTGDTLPHGGMVGATLEQCIAAYEVDCTTRAPIGQIITYDLYRVLCFDSPTPATPPSNITPPGP